MTLDFCKFKRTVMNMHKAGEIDISIIPLKTQNEHAN